MTMRRRAQNVYDRKKRKRRSQVIQNTPRTQERYTSVQCNKSSLLPFVATDLALGLLRIPAGFHVVVKTDSAECQTSNKPVHVDQAVVEWTEPILLYVVLDLIFPAGIEKDSSPCETSSKVWVSVYASFELGPMLCHGEVLRTFEISVRELLDRSENSHPMIFQPKQGEVISLCTSLFMTLEQRCSVENDTAVLCLLTDLMSCDMDPLVPMTDTGHHLLARYHRAQNSSDLDQSINHFERASDLCPIDHPCCPAALFNLATAKLVSCQAGGRYLDLDIPIHLFQDALDLRPTDHPDQTVTQLHLAIALLSHFAKRGFQTDADAAGELLSEVLDASHADSHIHRAALIAIETSALHSVGSIDANDPEQERLSAFILPLTPNQLAERAAWCLGTDEPRALDEVISLHYDALKYCNIVDTYRGQLLSNLSAIALQREALALYPVSHTERYSSLNNLAHELCTRFEHQRNREDFDESRDNLRSALTLLTQYDPRQLVVHESLAGVHLSFHHSGLDGTGVGEEGEDNDSLNAVMYHLKAAANVVSGGSLSHLRASLRWVHHASQHSHATELEAYATSMQLLDAYMSTTASVSSYHNIMMAPTFPSMLAVDAASCALHSGDVCCAVEFLQTCGDHAAALVKKFRDLSSLLNKSPANDREATPTVDAEAEEARYRHLVKEWNGAVEEIRRIEGFSCFLLPPSFSDLRDAARGGPIIMLITSKSSCDAIIIWHEQPPTKIPLPTKLEKLQTLVARFQRRSTPALTTALIELWEDVVRPVVENLGGFAQRRPRIWRHGQFLSQLYVSSYTPSLTALIKARRNHDGSLSVSFAAIGQNRPAGASFTLECVEPELELVRSLLPPPPTVSFAEIMSVDATRSRALRTLRDNTWLHFSCHGTQKYQDPFNSAFLMQDHPLSLLDITQTDLFWHEFAFLSACDTAGGDYDTPDEVIHLAAGLQFAGVKSVVGTLWKVSDSTVQRLVEAFYKNLCRDGKMNSKRAARALHQAVQSLACDKDMPLEQRIVFIHIGV
ncbi:CHAT domain-containing protein [Suillus subalutaceus]|uniref:CHAT domain-containing protein n=1 Tax=Suillus subalutaceus TaxID=48586 RepID=UPI001B87D485|nr:CHAT domain-containing protein [Suillus subalutaceus]KAG1838378.1 CHAT domain-containing protein [Suillus subalutaceus]